MLLFLILVWVVLVVAVCAVCAAGGAADDSREKWYDQRRRDKEPPTGPNQDAA